MTNVVFLVCGMALGGALLHERPAADDNASPAMDLASQADKSHQQQHSSDLVERWIDVASDIDESMGQQLRAMCDRDPQEFDRVMRQTGRRLIGMAELKQHDPDLYQLKLSEMKIESQVETAAQRLADAVRSGNEEDVQALEGELLHLVRMQVALSIRARGDYLLRLREHMTQLEQEIEQEARNFEQTVEQRMQEIVRRSQAIIENGG